MVRHHICVVHHLLFHGPVTHSLSAIEAMLVRHDTMAKGPVLLRAAHSSPTLHEQWTGEGIGVGGMGSTRSVSVG